MHDIEPFYGWREKYVSSNDEQSPFYGVIYNEFTFTNKIYNYFVHPQWDSIGTETLYVKVLFADYEQHFAIIELIGEWNDCLRNDIMFLKREVIDKMININIHKFVLCCENVMDFHSSDESYYEEWFDDIKEYEGWICFLDTREHMQEELNSQNIHHYVNYGPSFNFLPWRQKKPAHLIEQVEGLMQSQIKSLH